MAELIGVEALLREICVKLQYGLWFDNLDAPCFYGNSIFHARIKYIEKD
jgi:hypothetical protein